MTRVTIITLMQSIARSFPQRQCKQHRQLQEQNKPYVIRYHVYCEVNSYPNSPGPQYSLPQATYVHHAAARPAHGVEDHHILLGPAFRLLYHDPQCMSPIGMFGESPSWRTPVVGKCLSAAQQRHHRLFITISIAHLLYPECRPSSVAVEVDLMPNNTVDTTAWCHGVVIPQPPSR